jgi:hypothetical protein
MELSYRIAVISHRRAKVLCAKTLSLLRGLGFPADIIHVFIDEPEIPEYSAAIADAFSDFRPNVCRGGVGTMGQRRVVEDYFSGARVVCLDDDIGGFKIWGTDLAIPQLFEECFRIAEKAGCNLWGLHPSDNGLSMKDMATVGLSYIIGSCFGMKCVYKIDYTNHLTEDFERTVQYYKKDGQVIRFNGIGIKTKYFAAGGLEEFRVGDAQVEAARDFHKRHPTLCRLRIRENKPADVVIKTLALHRYMEPFRES